MPEIAQSHGGAEFIELCVGAAGLNIIIPAYPEVLQEIYLLTEISFFIIITYRSALYGIKNLCGVEAEAGSVPVGSYAPSLIAYTKSVGSIIYHLKPVFFGYPVYFLNVADIPVYVHRKDRTGLIGDQILDLIGIDGIVLRIYVTEYRLQAASYDRMGSGGKGKGRCDDLSLQFKSLKGQLDRSMSIRKKLYIIDSKPCLKLLPEPFMLLSHVREPVIIPDRSDLIYILIDRRKRRPGNQYLIIHDQASAPICLTDRALRIIL